MVGWEFPSVEGGARDLDPEEASRPVDRLAMLLKRSSFLVEQIRNGEGESIRRLTAEQERMRAELEASRAEVVALGEMMARLERRSSQLTNLYVATFQLYAGRDPDQVYETIAEITSDILGAERFALLMRAGEAPHCRVVLRHGFAATGDDPFWNEEYSGGQPTIDDALTHGTRWVQTCSGGPVAVVPLKVDQTILGALVILELLDHKPRLDDADSEILDLLGAHAASALLSSMNHSSTQRKLQTMTSLFRLVVGDSK